MLKAVTNVGLNLPLNIPYLIYLIVHDLLFFEGIMNCSCFMDTALF